MKKAAALPVFIFVVFFNFCPVISVFAQYGEALELNGKKTLINLDVKNMELVEVIGMIANQSGLNIILSKNVRGKVSIVLQDVGVKEALRAILKVNNCTYIKEGDIIQVYTFPEFKQREQFVRLKTRVFSLRHIRAVDSKILLDSLKSERGKVEIEPKTNRIVVTDTLDSIASIEEAIKEMDKKLETKVYHLNYASPVEIKKSLLAIISDEEGEVLVDKRTGSLAVTASPLLLEKIDVLIDNWDKKVSQVLIEAKIIQITREKGKFIGLDWQYQASSKHSIIVGSKDLPLPTGVTYVDAFRIGVLSADDYEITLRALEGLGNVQIISSPRIVALDNEEARILIGSSEPYSVLHYDSDGHLITKETKFVDVGIKLTVTPKISKDGFITMKIHPEVSSPRKGTVVTDELAIDTTEAMTVVRTKDGDTVVLGGLIKDENEEYISKIPLLGDIPLLGKLFRNTYTKKTKKEIVIFITTKILTDTPVLSKEEKELFQ